MSSPSTEPASAAPPTSSEDAPTLLNILSGDTGTLVLGGLDFAAVAALFCCFRLRPPPGLLSAVEERATEYIATAPLWSAAADFESMSVWPVTVAAADWHPRPFFACLRAPARCRLTGAGSCSHGLCRKQETPREGVLELFELLARRGTAPVASCALECIAWVWGGLGRKEAALRAWRRAAAAGSARALLDIGLRGYRSRGSPSTLYGAPGGAPPPRSSRLASKRTPERTPAPSAEAMLRAASASRDVAALGLEGQVIRALARVHLGMMALDGDGSAQDDGAALEHFEGAARAVRSGRRLHASRRREWEQDASGAAVVERAREEKQEEYQLQLIKVLEQVGQDAHETLQSMDRFAFFANGRP